MKGQRNIFFDKLQVVKDKKLSAKTIRRLLNIWVIKKASK